MKNTNPYDTPYPTAADPDRKLRDSWEESTIIIECESCGTTDMDQDESICEECDPAAYQACEPTPPEDGGYFGWAGMTEA